MRIRTNFFVSLDGKVSGSDGRPVQLLLPGFTGAGSYGLPEFLAGCEAVVMGRTTFLPALDAPRWPWTQPVFVLTSSALPEGTPADVQSAATAAELVALMERAGVAGDVHLVGGPATLQAFRRIDALAEVWLHVVPMILGDGLPLAGAGTEPLSLTLQSTRTFPDGVVESRYALAEAHPRPIPAHLHTVTPRLVVRDGAAAIEFYRDAFGAEEVGERFLDPAGRVIHAELRIGDSVVMITEETGDADAATRSPQSLGGSLSAIMATYWEDVDAVWQRAVAAGAEVVYPLEDQFYGERGGRVRDPFGQQWMLSQHTEDLSADEMSRRAGEFFGSAD